MLYLYGWRKKRIGVTPITQNTCVTCNVRQSLFIETFRSYLHFFQLPIIPLFKSCSSFCGHCKQSLSTNEMPPDLQNRAHTIKKKTITPWYFFVTPIAIFFLIVIATKYTF